jgi:hypothetical protein
MSGAFVQGPLVAEAFGCGVVRMFVRQWIARSSCKIDALDGVAVPVEFGRGVDPARIARVCLQSGMRPLRIGMSLWDVRVGISGDIGAIRFVAVRVTSTVSVAASTLSAFSSRQFTSSRDWCRCQWRSG